MISPEDRFWIIAEAFRGNVHGGYVIDRDQRRWYIVCGPRNLLPPEEEKEIGIIQRCINRLPQNIHLTTVDDNTLLVSTNAGDDPILTPYYPRYSDASPYRSAPQLRCQDLTSWIAFALAWS